MSPTRSRPSVGVNRLARTGFIQAGSASEAEAHDPLKLRENVNTQHLNYKRKKAEIEGIEDKEMLLDNGTMKKHEHFLNMKLLRLDLSLDKMQCRAQTTKA